MNHLDRNTRSTIRRILKYGSTLLAVCGLVGRRAGDFRV
jgi:hypothetical protein